MPQDTILVFIMVVAYIRGDLVPPQEIHNLPAEQSDCSVLLRQFVGWLPYDSYNSSLILGFTDISISEETL